MTRLRAGGAAAPQAPRPAPARAQAHRPGRPVTVDTGTGIAAGDDGPPGRRNAPGSVAGNSTQAGADGVPRAGA